MSDLRSDMSRLHRICGRICPIKQKHMLRKSRSRDKTMNLSHDKLIACKLNTMELREIKETNRSNINSKN
jgi:hypothetical protein